MSEPNMFDHVFGRLTFEEGTAFLAELGRCRTYDETVAAYVRWLFWTSGRPNRYAKAASSHPAKAPRPLKKPSPSPRR